MHCGHFKGQNRGISLEHLPNSYDEIFEGGLKPLQKNLQNVRPSHDTVIQPMLLMGQ